MSKQTAAVRKPNVVLKVLISGIGLVLLLAAALAAVHLMALGTDSLLQQYAPMMTWDERITVGYIVGPVLLALLLMWMDKTTRKGTAKA